MIHTSMPASVNASRPPVAATAKKRTGLIPMQVGSSHNIAAEIDGAARVIVCQARSPEDFPGVDAYFFCLHERCAGRKWGSIDAMRTDHPQKSHMDKMGEVHVYGAWSDEAFAEDARAAAEKRVKLAEEAHLKAEIRVEEAQTVGALEVAKNRTRDAFATLLEAQKALAAVSGCVGLMAPPDAEGA